MEIRRTIVEGMRVDSYFCTVDTVCDCNDLVTHSHIFNSMHPSAFVAIV